MCLLRYAFNTLSWSGNVQPPVYSRRRDGSQTPHGQPGKPAHADERRGVPSVTHSATSTRAHAHGKASERFTLGSFML